MPYNSPSSSRPPAAIVSTLTLHVAAFTGMRRGEVAGLAVGRLEPDNPPSVDQPHPPSRCRTVHRVRPKTRTSRRCIDLDPTTERHPADAGEPASNAMASEPAPNDPIFTNTGGEPLHSESISQLFDRHRRHAPTCPVSGSTTYATPTPPCSPQSGRADQGRQRTTRTLHPRLHDGDLPARHSRHATTERPKLLR